MPRRGPKPSTTRKKYRPQLPMPKWTLQETTSQAPLAETRVGSFKATHASFRVERSLVTDQPVYERMEEMQEAIRSSDLGRYSLTLFDLETIRTASLTRNVVKYMLRNSGLSDMTAQQAKDILYETRPESCRNKIETHITGWLYPALSGDSALNLMIGFDSSGLAAQEQDYLQAIRDSVGAPSTANVSRSHRHRGFAIASVAGIDDPHVSREAVTAVNRAFDLRDESLWFNAVEVSYTSKY